MRLTLLGHLQCEGGFNDGIEVWQQVHSQGKLLIRKNFRRQDLPEHARREVHLLKQLSGCSYIVHMYSASVNSVSGEIFMECCGKGTIKDLIRKHRQWGRLIPESFIWHVFYSLVEAVHYMQYGPNGNAWRWNYVFHRDLHPGNIFVTGNRNTGLHVVLGDFGSAVSRDWVDGCRVNMQAVEFGIPETHMNPYSDIYQIGLDIVAMCRLTCRPLLIVRPARGRAPRELAGTPYSDALNRLVGRCLQTNPNGRPNIKSLRAELWRVHGNRRSSCHDPRRLLMFPTLRIVRGRL
jgi:serine/threonine protein kinase